MSRVTDAVGVVGRSVFRTMELFFSVAVLLLTGVGLWLVLMEPGSSEGGGIVVFVILVAAAASVLLAMTTVIHAGLDAVRFATD